MSDAVRYICWDCQRDFIVYEDNVWEAKYCPYCGKQHIARQ